MKYLEFQCLVALPATRISHCNTIINLQIKSEKLGIQPLKRYQKSNHTSVFLNK